jgi:DNA processing protein
LKSQEPLNDNERRAWLRLARSPNVGAATFRTLIERFGSASAANAQLPRLIRRGGGDGRPLPTEAAAAQELEGLSKLGGRLLASIEPHYPPSLAALDAPPPLISVLGNAGLLSREMVAIVGARNASALGRRFAGTLAQELSLAGLVVVSGMARGIDSAAHEGALANGTVAVVAGGVDNIYPPENAKLYERLRAEGAIVSEMPLGLSPQARHFPRRNRLISGLARGVIVIEAAEGSGSLITANFALEQGREVFAVPGSPLDPRARGTNRLIREGATLTETADDVLAVLNPIIGGGFKMGARAVVSPENGQDDPGSDGVRALLLEALGPTPIEVDELVRRVGAPTASIQSLLLELELAGRITRHPGGLVSWGPVPRTA